MTTKITQDKFIEMAKDRYKDKGYDYALVEYKDYYTNVNIVCPKHGIFTTQPKRFVKTGMGCKRCQSETTSGRLDLTGKKFSMLVVLGPDDTRECNERKQSYWLCKCDCGEEKSIKGSNIVKKTTKSCGCLRGKNRSEKKNIIGKVYGNLKVIKESDKKEDNGQYFWICECVCGKEIETRGRLLRSGGVKSCGCIRQARRSKYPSRGAGRAYQVYKKAAKKKNREFNFSIEEFVDIVQKDCYYCGSAPSNEIKISDYKYMYNGIDRVDNGLGYTKENCVPCCKMCNFAKKDYKQDVFLTWIKNVFNKLIKQKQG